MSIIAHLTIDFTTTQKLPKVAPVIICDIQKLRTRTDKLAIQISKQEAKLRGLKQEYDSIE